MENEKQIFTIKNNWKNNMLNPIVYLIDLFNNILKLVYVVKINTEYNCQFSKKADAII